MALQAYYEVVFYASEYNAMAIKDDSKSEGLSVIERIVVQNLPHMETWLT
jgi:hypothetical protein